MPKKQHARKQSKSAKSQRTLPSERNNYVSWGAGLNKLDRLPRQPNSELVQAAQLIRKYTGIDSDLAKSRTGDQQAAKFADDRRRLAALEQEVKKFKAGAPVAKVEPKKSASGLARGTTSSAGAARPAVTSGPTAKQPALSAQAQADAKAFKKRWPGALPAPPVSGYSTSHRAGSAAAKAVDKIRAVESKFAITKPEFQPRWAALKEDAWSETSLKAGPADRAFSETVRRTGDMPEIKDTVIRDAPVSFFGAVPRPHLSEIHSHTSGNAMKWTACERLKTQSINSAYNTQGAQLLKVIGNPTMCQAERMKIGAQMFDNFKFENLRLRWSSSLGTNAQGRIAAAFDPDSSDPVGFGEDGLTKLMSHGGASTTHMYTDHHWVMPAGCERTCWTKYSAADDSDIRQTDQFTFWALVSTALSGSGITVPGPAAAPLEIGEWYVEYTIHYFNQTLENELMGSGWISYNSSSPNLLTTISNASSSLGFAAAPFIGQDAGDIVRLPSSTEPDVVVVGPLSTSVTFKYVALDAVATGQPSAAGFYPTIPAAPLRVNWRSYLSDADCGSTRDFHIIFFNPSDPTSYGSYYIRSDGTTLTRVIVYNNLRGNMFKSASGTVALTSDTNWGDSTVAITNAGQGSGSLLVDPSVFRYNPPSIGVMLTCDGTSMTTAVWDKADIQFEVLATQVAEGLGLPSLDPQGNLLSFDYRTPTRNTFREEAAGRKSVQVEFNEWKDARRKTREYLAARAESKGDTKSGLGLQPVSLRPAAQELEAIELLEKRRRRWRELEELALKDDEVVVVPSPLKAPSSSLKGSRA